MSGMITASITATVGGLWWGAFDVAYRKDTSPVAEMKAALA
jgi:hypothetical protein